MRAGPAARWLATAVVVVTLSACGGGSSGGNASLRNTPKTHQLDDKSTGTTVDVQLGDTVIVTLHSTGWNLDVPATVLQPLGAPQTSPSPCPVMGGGCGTVTESYNAGHVGQVTLHAHRDSCGEALRCTGTQGDWSVTVRVS